LARNVAEGRRVLRQLLVGPIRFTPFDTADGRGYRFEGAANVGALVGSALTASNGEWRAPPGTEGMLPVLKAPFAGELRERRVA
jgi:hypothetical protein